MARSTLAVLLLCLSAVLAQAQHGKACWYSQFDRYSGCAVCQQLLADEYCKCTMVQPCTDGPGADVLILSGSCLMPMGNCVNATKQERIDIASAHRLLPQNKWISRTDLPQTLAAPSTELARALTTIQAMLSAEDVDACYWANMTLNLRNKAVPDEPWVAELKDMGNGYVLKLVKRGSKPVEGNPARRELTDEEIGTKWTLHLGTNNWSLESTAGDRIEGVY